MTRIKIAAIGDIHDRWDREDNIALQQLGVDLALFVGDFGNESIAVVRHLVALDVPYAAILGNHDAWYTASAWGRKKCPYDREVEDRVAEQLTLLAEAHVGYSQREFSDLDLAVVGSRPFSWGGQTWKNEDFYRDRYGIHNFAESAHRIVTTAQNTTSDTIIFLAHNGPYGLGDRPEDPCGKDWEPIGGDHGDPDFQDAIAQVQSLGKKVPLVVFGHMHHRLRHTTTQLRTAVVTDDWGTVYLNAAVVPRVVRDDRNHTLRNFSLITLEAAQVRDISLVWLDDDGEIASQQFLYERSPSLSISESET
ncbi:MAG: TIGR04168 family protein [Jaaginema sp. PMC 1079.18]|nr:TIGR04168 family protein [Jaaginema sp. PMC 1080.18]MEC4852388.1 TIGR04168 family protein [Jaaginema sp. PMC 1079.18]MEC4867636.1 TIGR04168 family protein [Jaaginema sp. PMC 1078.18]